MNLRQDIRSLKKFLPVIEWRLLAFLVLFLDVKLALKLAALVLVYLLQPNLKFGFKTRNTRLPIFYLAVMLITIFNFIVYQDYSDNYTFVMLSGLMFWLACILAIHQVKLFAERTDIDILHNTLLAFFALNIFFSFLNLSTILLEIGFRNPFRYQGEYQKYFINTGDHIKGISFDTSNTNAIINCFGIVYFLYIKKYRMVAACMATLLFTASNCANIILFLVLTGIFIFNSVKEQKSVMIICALMLVVFMVKLSPQNDNYAGGILSRFVLKEHRKEVIPEKIIPIRERPDSLLTTDTRKEKMATLFLDSLEREKMKQHPFTASKSLRRPQLPEDSIHTASFQWKRDTTTVQRQLLTYVRERLPHFDNKSKYQDGVPGKVLALHQSILFLKDHPHTFITGTGIGNFSSKLAFRATGLKMAGGFPKQFLYCNPYFLTNHLQLYAWFFSHKADYHSIIHYPDSVYDQLFTEYGFIGLLLFPVYYVGYFLRHSKQLTYGLPLLAMLLAFFMMNYWFEQLSIVVLFELMMFINIKEQKLVATNE